MKNGENGPVKADGSAPKGYRHFAGANRRDEF